LEILVQKNITETVSNFKYSNIGTTSLQCLQFADLHILHDRSIPYIFRIHQKEPPATTMNFSLTLLVATALFIMASAQKVGCQPKPPVNTGAPSPEPTNPPPNTGAPFPADPTSPNVIRAVDFAVADSYNMNTTTFKVLNGTEQSLNGRRYDLDVAVTETADGYCTVFNYVVNELATQTSTTPYVLVSSNELDQQC
jgi:hypothetical protein